MQYSHRMRTVAVRMEDDLHALISRAAHRREMSLAKFVRLTLKEAAEFYADPRVDEEGRAEGPAAEVR